MRNAIVAAVLVLGLSGPAGAAEPPPIAFPGTTAGKRVAAFFDAFGSGSEERLAEFFSSAVSPEGLRQHPAAARAKRLGGLRQEVGGAEVRRVDAPSAGQVVVVTEGEGKRLTRWTFGFGPPPETFLLGIGIDEANASDLAGPPPPMSEAKALAAIEKAAADAAAVDRFSGVVLVARDGKVLLHRAFGFASREHGVPNRPDTKFNLGSINKIFTRVAVGQLVEAGRLSLDDTVGKHIPDYPNPEARQVTVRQLLEMQSGIGDFFGEEFEATPKDRLRTNADFLPLFAKKPLLFAPGTDRRYSNGGYVVLGEIVARASGRGYHEYVRENVYARAGMADTESFEADVPVPNLAEGYTRSWDGEERTEGPRRRNIYTRPARGSAAGGGYSTAPDLLRFASALKADRLLSPPFTEWFVTGAGPVPGPVSGDRKRGAFGFAGGAPGINALLELDRETGLVVVVLANDDPPAATALGREIGRLLGAIAMAADADTIYFGGPIITVNDRHPTAEAVAVKGGKIVAVGPRSAVEKAQKGRRTAMVDLGGRTMIPGFIDAHGHMWGAGVQAMAANLLPPPDGGVRSIADLQEQLRKWMASSRISRDFGVVIGFGYDDSQLAERRHPTAADLDAVSTDLPMIVIHQSGHLHALNTKALQMAGIDAATEDPQGGVIRRKPGTREPSGVMEGTVLIREFLRIMPKLGPEQQLALLEAGQKLYAKYGHTTAQEGRALPGNVELYVAAARAGRLDLDVVVYPEALLVPESGGFMKGPYVGRTYRNGLRIGGVKLTLDASPQGRTAWLTQPYLKAPEGQPADFAGYPALRDDQAIAAISRAYRNGWQILVHTNGDAAIDQLLRAVTAASARHPGRDRRTVMIHGQTLREDQVPKLKALGIFPALFPMHTFYWGDWYVDTVLGPDRAANISPTGWMTKNGMIFSSHHDAPVAFPDTMRVLSATVNRTTRSGQVLGPEHRVEPIVALKAMTLWAAYQHFEEKTKGSIEVGKLADFAILSENPLTIDRQKIADIKVVETIKKGKSIYRLDPAKTGKNAVPCMESSRCSERFAAFRANSPLAELLGPAPHVH